MSIDEKLQQIIDLIGNNDKFDRAQVLESLQQVRTMFSRFENLIDWNKFIDDFDEKNHCSVSNCDNIFPEFIFESFTQKTIDELDWQIISENLDYFSDEFLIKYAEKIDWEFSINDYCVVPSLNVIKYLASNNLLKTQEVWNAIVDEDILTEDLIIKYEDRIDMDLIGEETLNRLSDDTILKFAHRLPLSDYPDVLEDRPDTLITELQLKGYC